MYHSVMVLECLNKDVLYVSGVLIHKASNVNNLHFLFQSADFGPWPIISTFYHPSQSERGIPLSEQMRSLGESSDKVGQPATQLGGKFDCVGVWLISLRGNSGTR